MSKHDLGIKVDTSPVITDFLLKRSIGKKIVITTYQSGSIS